MKNNSKNMKAVISIGEPKVYGTKENIIEGLLVLAPMLILLGLVFEVFDPQADLSSLLYGYLFSSLDPSHRFEFPVVLLFILLIICLVVWFSPFLLFANWYIHNIGKRMKLREGKESSLRIFEISLEPRLRKWGRNLNTADDIGFLDGDQKSFIFKGDRITLSIPYSEIRSYQKINLGWKFLWLFQGLRITCDLKEYNNIVFLDRSSFSLSRSRWINNLIYDLLNERMKEA
jgi:hypothetical protein